jgi:hypothetical protein
MAVVTAVVITATMRCSAAILKTVHKNVSIIFKSVNGAPRRLRRAGVRYKEILKRLGFKKLHI